MMAVLWSRVFFAVCVKATVGNDRQEQRKKGEKAMEEQWIREREREKARERERCEKWFVGSTERSNHDRDDSSGCITISTHPLGFSSISAWSVTLFGCLLARLLAPFVLFSSVLVVFHFSFFRWMVGWWEKRRTRTLDGRGFT